MRLILLGIACFLTTACSFIPNSFDRGPEIPESAGDATSE